MAVRSRIDPIAKDIGLFVSEMLSPAAQSAAIAAFARDEIAKADNANRTILGRLPRRTVTVNGSAGAPLEAIRPGGSIVAEWELISDVMIWIGNTLRERSPVRSGRYRDAHTLFADSREVPIGKEVPEASEYVFLNPLPYARKIEIGKTRAGRNFVIQVPNRIYERTAKDASDRFGNIARIKFSYRAPEGSHILKYVPIRSRATREASHHEKALRVPAIIVTLKSS
jgi:hypothetical protein